MPSIHWKKIIFAGVTGFVCGNIYSQSKKHPTIAVPILQGAVAAGACGSILGLGIAAYRNLPSHVYAISLGANFAVTMASFLGTRHCVVKVIESQNMPHPLLSRDYLASSISGLMIGTVIAILSKNGVKSLLLTSLSGFVAGIGGQYSFDKFELWRKHKAIEMNYPELLQHEEQKKWSLEGFQSWWLGFWHRQSRAAEVEAHMTWLQEAIEEEKLKIVELDNQLVNLSHRDPPLTNKDKIQDISFVPTDTIYEK